MAGIRSKGARPKKSAPPSDDPFGILAAAPADYAAMLSDPRIVLARLGADAARAPLADSGSPDDGQDDGSPDGSPDGQDDGSPDGASCATRGGDSCGRCGAQMCRDMDGLGFVCAGCGLVAEGDPTQPGGDDAPRAASGSARLRIVGPNSNQLQPDLYRSGAGDSAATQKKHIYDEFCAYRSLYIEAGGPALPLDACRQASEFYNEVQRRCVKRSQNKKAIMAACFYHACIALGFSPAKTEIAAFLQLPNKGIARGSNFVRALVADGQMAVDVNADPCRPEITTLFAHLGLEGARYDGLRGAVFDVVQAAIENNIGTGSILRSKVAGATYAVLSRCPDASLVKRPSSLQDFCQDRIRKNTVERFVRQLESYHSYFAPCFARAGLDAAPPRVAASARGAAR